MEAINSEHGVIDHFLLDIRLVRKGWKVYNLETGVISVSRDVIFQETKFP